jgi:hypothetical protein
MNPWPYVRGGIVTASFLGGALGTDHGIADFGISLPAIAFGAFALGVVGMLLVVGIQAFNPRSDATWAYPKWTANPFRLGQPLQFFHLGGYFFLFAGIGALLRWLFVRETPLLEPIALSAWGAGILAGVWCCTRVFRRKMGTTN